MEQSDKKFKTDGCSWFPDLWIFKCCEKHDKDNFDGKDKFEADIDFLVCIVRESKFLKAFTFLFAGFIVTGMALGRPIRNFLIKTIPSIIGKNKL